MKTQEQAAETLPVAECLTETHRLPRWLYLYFLLAGCLFIVLLASLFFDNRLLAMQKHAICINRAWSQRSHCYTEVGQLAADVDAPGNDVFETGRPEVEAANLRTAVKRFDDAMEVARADLTSDLPSKDTRALSQGLERLDACVKKMAVIGEEVFVAINKSHNDAGERMAAMDRQYKEVRSAIYTLEEYISDVQGRTIDQQEVQTASLMQWQYGLDGLIGAMTVGVVAYAVMLSKRIADATRESERNTFLLKESEEALRRETAAAGQANRAKSNFLANMSHEIRTPMTAIMGYVEVLSEPDVKESERAESINVIRRSAKHLIDLVNDILDISKIEADKMTVECIPTDVSQIVADVVSFMRPSAIAKGLRFNLAFGESVPRRIWSDPIRVKQVLVNLVGNAVKFTDRGEIAVRLSSSVENSRCVAVLEVADTGIGMTEDQIQRVFQPFTQADDSTTRRFGGTGLGLTISAGLAQLLGGELTVKSQPGAGKAFRLTVDGGPIENVELVQGFSESLLTTTPSQPTQARVALHGRFLLAEDGPDNQRLIAGHLRKAGAEVVVADNGRIAVELALVQPFDVILMDMQMPELDGYAATRELRRLGYAGPIVALTAHAMAEDREKCIHAGCTDYLTKPIEKCELLTGVARHLSASSSRSLPRTLRSSFADDPDMTEVIKEFIAVLPERVSELHELLEKQRVTDLRRAAHQLKGAAGGFGFDCISGLAAQAEQSLINEDCLESIRTKVYSLIDQIRTIDGYQNECEVIHA